VSATPEDEGIPTPDELPPGVDADLAEEGIMVPGDDPRGAGHRGETAAEQRVHAARNAGLRPGPERNLIADEMRRAPASHRVAPRREPGDPAQGQLAGAQDDPDAVELLGNDEGLGPEERAMSIVEAPGPGKQR
jgi:hypothetical protein